jgi:stage V sporulation protein AB
VEIIKQAVSILIGFSSGVVISGAVFAFITVLGVVPRFAHKTGTGSYTKLYETALMTGGILGTLAGIMKPYIPIGSVAVVIVGLCIGIFFGCLAMSLAEVLNVIPILSRRGRLHKGMFFFVLAIALGKLGGSLLYFLKPGFFDAGTM